MFTETKDQYLEKMMAEEKPVCPHCNQAMSVWEVPPINFSDGLGWCAPYLYVCFNDECSLYTEGWKNMEENYGQAASYRCIRYRNETEFECMPVFNPHGAKGQLITDQTMMEEEMLRENTKKGFLILAECYVEKDSIGVTQILTDSTQPPRVRLKAAEMIGDIGLIESVELLRALTFSSEVIQKKVKESYAKILERHFARECPFCSGIIKKKASICRHCSKDVAGK